MLPDTSLRNGPALAIGDLSSATLIADYSEDFTPGDHLEHVYVQAYGISERR